MAGRLPAAAAESPEVQTTTQVQTATTHPMKYYISLPKNWAPDRKWPVLVAPSAHYGDKGPRTGSKRKPSWSITGTLNP